MNIASHRTRKAGRAFPAGQAREDLREYVAERLHKGVCSYCGTKFVLTEAVGVRRVHPSAPTLDQVLPGRGYSLGNVRVICFTCNAAKGSKTLDAFNDWVRRCFAHLSR